MTRSLSILWVLLLTWSASATQYYVDFVGGNDTNNGTSTSTPWQHCPGDAKATGIPAATPLVAGDTVIFKGGVTYRGIVQPNFGGTIANPITLQGNGWGTTNAIISGAEQLNQTWTQCISVADADGCQAYSNLWWTVCPTNVEWDTLLFSGNNQCFFANDPNPSDFIAWQTLTNFIYATNGGSVYYTASNIVDAAYFTSFSNYYVGGCIAELTANNVVDVYPITNINVASGTMSYLPNGDVPSLGQDYYFKLLNLPLICDRQWETAIITNQNRIYLYSTNNPNSLSMEISRRGTCIKFEDASNIVVTGFKMVGACYAQNDPLSDGTASGGTGAAVEMIYGGICLNIKVSSNEIYMCRGSGGGGGDQEIYVNGSGETISYNSIHDCLNRGIEGGAQGLIISSNSIFHNSGTGMAIRNTSGLIIGNVITNLLGVHSDGIATYNVWNMTIADNYVVDLEYPLAWQAATNILIYNNVLDSGAFADGGLNEWDSGGGTNYIFNNIAIGGPSNHGLFMYSTATNDVYFVFNNILQGSDVIPQGSGRSVSDNIYTALQSSQISNGTNNIGPSERVVTNTALLFVNKSAGDYRLPSGSPAIGAGTNLSAFFTTDITGKTRPASGAWDIGAYTATNSAPSTNGPNILWTRIRR